MPEARSVTQAVILAGGAGTRLRPLVSDLPKPLAPVCGRPFIEYLLCQLARAGIQRAVLLAGYLAERLSDELGAERHGVELRYSVESEPLGTGGALKNAEALLIGERWLVLNGDSLIDIELDDLVQAHLAAHATLTLALAAVPDGARYGSVATSPDGAVTAFVEKADPVSARHASVNAGVYVVERSVVAAIPSARQVSFEREVLPSLIGRGLRAKQFDGYFVDIGIPDDYRRAQRECEIFERLASGRR